VAELMREKGTLTMENWRVAIVIATRNRWNSLRRTLESAQMLDYPKDSLRIIVIDNGSSDTDYQALVQYANFEHKYSIEVDRVPVPNKSAALNKALAKLKEEKFVAFTDDDVILSRVWIRAFEEVFDRSTCQGIQGKIKVCLDASVPEWFTDQCKNLYGEYQRNDGVAMVNLSGGNMAVRMDTVKRIGQFRTDLGPANGRYSSAEDSEWSSRIHTMGGELRYCNAASLDHMVGHVTFYSVWWRQFEYAKREVVWKSAVPLRAHLRLIKVVYEMKYLVGSIMLPRRQFQGHDRLLELAQRCGRVAGHISYLLPNVNLFKRG
jgi:glycosyltransferase involved in cell wall biosynthesis